MKILTPQFGVVCFLWYNLYFFLSRYLFILAILIYALLHGLLIPYTNRCYRVPLDAIFIITGTFGLFSIFKQD
jgi:hypothetical protein